MILITGRSGSGKSTVAKKVAEELGKEYIDVDKVGHSLYDRKEVLDLARELFGEVVFNEDGKFNRKKMGKIFFGEKDSERVKFFSDFTWKLMEKVIDQEIETKDCIIDWILLPTTKYWDMNSIKVLVKSQNDNERLGMILKRDNISQEYLKSREKSAIEYNENDFDLVLINDYKIETINKLAGQIEQIYKEEYL